MILSNLSFEDGWHTFHNGNQQPNNWLLYWDEPGDLLLAPRAGNGDTESAVLCVPECVHKLSEQLPADEQLGGKDALILDGSTTYKLFGSTAFRAKLSQQFGVDKGAKCTLVVPVQVHGGLKPDGTPYNTDTGAAYWRVSVNGYPGAWLTYNNDFQDRTWFEYSIAFTAIYGTVDIIIEFESHTVAPVAFFTDNVQFSVQDSIPIEPECPKPREGWTHRISVLVREDAQDDVWLEACKWANDLARKHDVCKSWDHAFYGPGLESVKVILWYDNPDAFDHNVVSKFASDFYLSTNWYITEHYDYPDSPPVDPPPIEPPPDFTPINYTPQGCKLFWHGVGDDGQTDIQQHIMARRATMATAKAVQDVGWLKLIKQAGFGTYTVARFIDDGQGGPSLEGFDSNQKPDDQAHNRMNALMPLFVPHRNYVDYWEIVNEQDPEGADGHVKMALFFMTAMDIVETWGYKLALFSYSMGVPEPHEWDAIAEIGVFERAAQGGHAISLHEYGVWPIDAGSLLTRYRHVYEKHILPRGLNIPLFITEWAPDAWTLDMFHDNDLMTQIAAYDAELAKDPYVAGAHIFTVGGASGWPRFRNRWVELYGRYEDYVVSVKDRVNNG